MLKIKLFIITFGYTGYSKIAPGTVASLVTTGTIYLINEFRSLNWLSLIITAMVLIIVGIPLASWAEKHFQTKDPRACVMDEVIGQIISLIMVPPSIILFLASFLFFRIFDVLKPFPIKKVEKLPGGWGIMLDDVLAGGFALIFTHITQTIIY